MSKESRGYGTMIVATIGIFGAVAAALIGDYFNWRVAYFVGAALGFALLIMRIGVYESGMYDSIKRRDISEGNFLLLFKDKKNLTKYFNALQSAFQSGLS